MGANIARRLADVGYTVSAVYDIQPQHAGSLAQELGAMRCQTLGGITQNADIIITVVTDDAAMFDIFAATGDSLLVPQQPQLVGGKHFINCATVTPSVHREIERILNARGAHSLEACMASSIPQARNGTLYLMCGGKREAFERMRPLLEHMSSSLRYIGESGRAAQVKALVNMVMNINTAGLAEGLGLGDALGLDLEMLREVFSQTGAASRVLETDGADMQNRDHDCYFSAAHAAKDSGIALALARETGVDLPLAEATFSQYERMKHLGLGELDKSGVSELTFKTRHAEHTTPSREPLSR